MVFPNPCTIGYIPYSHVTLRIENPTPLPPLIEISVSASSPIPSKTQPDTNATVAIPTSAPTKLQPNPGSKTQLQHITDTGPSVPVYRYSLCARQNISTAVLDTYTHTDVTPIPLIYLDVFDFGAFVLNLATCS